MPPPGKRSHPDFEQTYIRKATHHAVKIENSRKEFSELVDELLHQCLKSST